MRTIFHVASAEEIRSGKTADVYFDRTVRVLKARGINSQVRMEVILKTFPERWTWGILAGIEEVVALLQGLPLDVEAMEEGTLFGPYQPVLVLSGNYLDFALYETALLGLLCQSSGIATKAARCKKAAAGRLVISFGARRMHPAITPMIERSAFIGGCDGVSAIKGAELLGEEPMGTIPHTLVLLLGDSTEAARAFHEVIEPKVRRVALVDTFQDEKGETLRAAEALGKDLFAVRLDTPASRRGDMRQILSELRWELDYRGHRHVQLLVSGGVDEYEILHLNGVADAYGVGTAISSASTMNFAMDIVEIDGKPVAKRGKASGRKMVYRCPACFHTTILPYHQPPPPCPCGQACAPLLKPLFKAGQLLVKLPSPQAIRSHVLDQLGKVELGV